ncbi:hypothetical protein KUV62_02200 [Salipiger bermudensis]|uniref:hypothetical protein n=1 Tax=Salipiger bermudensis TaxID=344736 RepID=UPI001C99FE7A|nr:hypothetical protein [Salipiger bermudensis]MBY6002701.1 hypothetical protein [Salipiger bermudensis]
MRALVWKVSIWLLVSAAMLVPIAWVEANGFLSSATIQMWAKAIVMTDGPAAFRATDAFYPPLPFSVALVMQSLSGGTGIPLPHVLSAALGGLLAVAWYYNLLNRAAYDRLSAVLVVLLLVLNPIFLRCLSEGPSIMFLILGSWLYFRGLVNIRLFGTAPDMMKVALGLLVATMSHELGVLFALASLPALVLAARPSLLVVSPTGYLVSMFFPVAAAVLSLFFVSAVLKTNFFAVQLLSPDSSWAGATFLALLCLLPVPLMVIFRLFVQPRFSMPLGGVILTLVGMALLNRVYPVEPDPILVAAPALGAAPVAARWWTRTSLRSTPLAALTLLSALLGFWALGALGGQESRAWLQAATGRPVPNPVAEAAQVAAFLRDQDGVLADVERHPDLVAAMGNARNFIAAGDPAYDRVLFGGRPAGNFVVIEVEENAPVVRDRLLRALPGLKNNNDSRFELVYDSGGWMVYRLNRAGDT